MIVSSAARAQRARKDSRHRRRSWLWMMAVIAVCGSSCRNRHGEHPPPDVVLVTVDTLRVDRLGYMGYKDARTPNIDGLAHSGTTLVQAITPMPRTTPALATLHTGLAPHHHGSREVGDPILEGVRLAEILRSHGYRTLAVSANATAGPLQGLDRGFDAFVTYEQLVARYGDDLYRDLSGASPHRTGWATATTAAALEMVEAENGSTPVFLWVFYFDPHFLYRPPSPWQDDVKATKCWELYEWGEADLRRGGSVFYDRGGVSSRALDHCSRLYDAELAYTDYEVGRLLERLDESRALDSAIVAFTADHGENLGEAGLFFEHGDNLHDAGLRVPLVFRGPGIVSGKVVSTPVGLADVGPTLLALLGITPPEGFGDDGADLSEMLLEDRDGSRRGRSAPAAAESRIVFAESASAMYREAGDRLTTGRRSGNPCLNGPRYSLCESRKNGRAPFRLFDRSVDPGFETDLAATRPDVLEELLAAWRRWPPETARLLAARTSSYKLVRSPRLEGGYTERLVDLIADPAEEIDVSKRESATASRLRAALDSWAVELTPIAERSVDPAVEKALRELGYIQ